MTDIDYVQQESGFTKSGGIWGQAWWKRHGDYVFSLGQGIPGEYLEAPSKTFAPTRLIIFDGNIHSEWTVNDGEPPCTESGNDCQFVSFLFPDLFHALHAVGWLIRGTMTAKQIQESVVKVLEEEAA